MSPFMCMVFVANLLMLMDKSFIQGRNISDEEIFKRTLTSTNKFKCGPPQPRVFPLSDIFDTNISSFCNIVVPASAVLHVCDFACGSCPQNMQCLPLETEEVTLAFKIIPRNNADKDGSCHFQTSTSRIETVTKVNHTRCSCQKPSNTPK